MIIGDRLREMREVKKLSQGDVEKRTEDFGPRLRPSGESRVRPACRNTGGKGT